MSLFHRHQWRETERISTPPVNLGTVEGIHPDRYERLVWGITAIVLTCDTCGWKQVIEVKGTPREGKAA